MAENDNINVKLNLDTSKVPGQLNEVKGQFDKFTESVKDSFGEGFKMAFGFGLEQGAEKAAEAIKDFVKESIKEFTQLDLATKQLQNSLSGLGKSEFYPQLAKQAETLADQYNFSVKSIEKSQSDLVTQNELSVNQVEKLQPVIANLARKTGESYEEASKQVQMALEGNGKALKQFGIHLEKGATAEQNFNIITGELADKVQGAADAYDNSAAGGIARFQHAVEKIQEQLGAKLFPILGDIAKVFSEVLDNIQPVEDVFSSIIEPIKEMFTEVGKLIQQLTGWDAKTTTVADTMQFLAKWIKLSMIPLKLLINSIIVTAKELGHLGAIVDDVFHGKFKAAFEEGKLAAVDYAEGVVKSIDIVKDGFKEIPKEVKKTDDDIVEEKVDLSKRLHKLTEEQKKKLATEKAKQEKQREKEYKERIKQENEANKQIYENAQSQTEIKKKFGLTDDDIDKQFNDLRVQNAWMSDQEIYKTIQKTLEEKKKSADEAAKADTEASKEIRENAQIDFNLKKDFKVTQAQIDAAYQEAQRKDAQITYKEFAQLYKDDLELKKKAEEEKKKAAKESQKEVFENAKQLSTALNDLDSLFEELASQRRNQSAAQKAKTAKKEFEIKKGLGIVNAAISTAEGIAKAVADSPETGGLPGSAFAAAIGAIQIATIAAKKYTPGSSSGGSSAPSTPSFSTSNQSAPSFQPSTFQGLGQSQLNSSQSQQAQQVYVTQTDLNNSARKVSVTSNRSKIG